MDTLCVCDCTRSGTTWSSIPVGWNRGRPTRGYGGGAAEDTGYSLLELRAAERKAQDEVNESYEALMKLISSPLPHHVTLSVHPRKLWREFGTFGTCP